MKCARCHHTGNAASLTKSSGAWWCKDSIKCMARVHAKWKTPSKRAAWKKKEAK